MDKSPDMAPTPYLSRLLLDTKKFRIVRVLPGQWTDPIHCRLIHRDLNEPSNGGSYRALSYVWGSAAVKNTIHLDDCPVGVTVNLFCALHYLRQTDVHIDLWADALVSHGLLEFLIA